MTDQRSRRAGKNGFPAISGEQIRLLDEVQFPWEADRWDSKWCAMYGELQQFHKENGHSQPGRSTHIRLCKWTRDQRAKHQKGLFSTEQVKLLGELDFSWESNSREWQKMFNGLTEYFNTRGHIQVGQEEEPELYDWMDLQRKRYHGMDKRELSDEQMKRLEDLHFCWSLGWRDRAWDEKYSDAVEYFKEHGHVLVTKKENPSLFDWIQTQEKRYKGIKGQKPLSEEELEMLEQIELPFLEGQPRMAWNAIYSKVVRYRDENDGRLPTSHKDEPHLSRWLRHQRYRYRCAYGYAPLSDQQKESLQSTDFSFYPQGKRARYWYEMYDELVDFWRENEHFTADRKNDSPLFNWVIQQRTCFSGVGIRSRTLVKMEVSLLESIGFPWTSYRYEMEWQHKYEELAKFIEARGYLPKMSENRKLVNWMGKQRIRYKGQSDREMTENEIQQLEKIGFQWSLRS